MIVVPKKNLAKYKKIAKEGEAMWKKYGAIDYKECVSDDMKPEHTGVTFPKMMKAKEDEVIVFAFVTYESKKQRNEINKKIEKDMEEAMKKDKNLQKDWPFDMKKFATGGFKIIVG